jgi:hypothetical protein
MYPTLLALLALLARAATPTSSKHTECASRGADPCSPGAPETHSTLHRVTDEMPARLNDGQALAALQAPRLEHLAPGERAHPLEKAVLTLARDAFWLPRSLHGIASNPFHRTLPRIIPASRAACQSRRQAIGAATSRGKHSTSAAIPAPVGSRRFERDAPASVYNRMAARRE